MSGKDLTQAELAAVYQAIDPLASAGQSPGEWSREQLTRTIRERLQHIAAAREVWADPVKDPTGWALAVETADQATWREYTGPMAETWFDAGAGLAAGILVSPGHVAISGQVPGMTPRATRYLSILLAHAAERAEQTAPAAAILEPEPSAAELAESRRVLERLRADGLLGVGELNDPALD